MTSIYTDYMYSYPHKTAYRLFPPLSLVSRLEMLQGSCASLYFHIPFCRSKCAYCNLFSLPGCDSEFIDTYLHAVARQAAQLAPLAGGLRFDSFAIGGGTPLLLTPKQLDKLLSLASLFHVDPQTVYTSVETSPEYADKERLDVLRRFGVSRLSIGIQSFRDDELSALGRRPRRADIYPALERICQAGFPTLNIDLIYGIKGQTPESLLYSLREALQFGPDELFIYPLYVRRGTGIREREDDDVCLRLYFTARDYLLVQGFRQTSMRRFVRRVDAETHSCGDEVMLSCGAGGRSYLGDLHCATRYSVRPGHIRDVLQCYVGTADYTVVDNGIFLAPDEQRRRYIIKNLLYYAGMDKEEYQTRFGQSVDADPLFASLAERGWLVDDGRHIRLTDEGMSRSDFIGPLFISPAIRARMDTYDY